MVFRLTPAGAAGPKRVARILWSRNMWDGWWHWMIWIGIAGILYYLLTGMIATT